MDASVILSSFLLLFLAEMGDKTQLMVMTLGHRYRAWPVIGGSFLAFLVLNLLAVWIGEALFRYVPQHLVLLAAGALFLYFALRSWRDAAGEEEGDDSRERPGSHGAFFSSFGLVFLAELGDKTQLALIALVAGTGEVWSVFVGGTLALWSVSALGVLVGSTLLRQLPRGWMHRAAAALFLVFGVAAIGQVLFGVLNGEAALAGMAGGPG